MYGDGDLSLTSTPLVDDRVPSTQAYADDLPLPVSSMPPPPVSKRTFTGVQRSSVDSGVVAGGSLNRPDSTRAGASLMGSTANFGAEQGEQVWSDRRLRHTRCNHQPLSCCLFGSLASRHIKSRVL